MSKKKMRVISELAAETVNSKIQEPEPSKIKHRLLNMGAVVLILATVFIGVLAVKPKPVAKSFVEYPMTTELPEGVDEAYIQKLTSYGLGNTVDVKKYLNISERIKWKNKFNLQFIGDNEMTKFLTDNSFIMGESERYIDNIPIEAGKEMMSNYDRIKDTIPAPPAQELSGFLVISGDGTIRSADTGDFNLRKIYIIAAASKFNTQGMKLEEGILKAITPPDPIAVVRVPNGYVELANW